MADATGFNANAHMAWGWIDDRQIGELQLAWAHRLHRPIGGLRRCHSRLPRISFGPKQCSGNLPACGRKSHAMYVAKNLTVPFDVLNVEKTSIPAIPGASQIEASPTLAGGS